jgi:hypothetical protein
MLEIFVNQAASIVSSAAVISAVELGDSSWLRVYETAWSSVIQAVVNAVTPAFHTKMTITQTF